MSNWKRRLAAVTAAGALAATAACSGSVSSDNGSGDEGEPVKGGTLNMLGTSDVDYMDPNVSYYSIGYLNLRMWARQLFTYPAEKGEVTKAVPDLATEIPTTENGGISKDAKTYTIKLRDDVMWNTDPARPVVAEDFVRGLKRTCNPVQPFGGLPNFMNLIVGFKEFCDGFSKIKNTDDPKSLAKYMESHDIAGATAKDDTTLVFELTHPATYFKDMLAMPAFSPAPQEYNKYLPASPELAKNLISNGPYKVEKWEPTKKIVYTRNPAWEASSDPVRKAYVDKIKVDLTVSQESIQQQLETGTPKADLSYATAPPPSRIPQLIAKDDPNLNLGETSSSNPYIVYNTVSPNNDNALSKLKVRKALMHAINRENIIQVLGGPDLNNPLSHVLPSNILGSEDIDLYEYDPEKAKQLLAEAGYPNGFTLKFLYRNASEGSTKSFQTVQQDLSKVGIKIKGVTSPDADFYTKYLQVPDVAKRGVWDLTLAGWGSDWYGNAALSYFKPLFSGEGSFPPNGSNFGFYDSDATNKLIKQAANAQTEEEAAELWAKADEQVMKDAAFFPITNPKEARYHASQVHNSIYMPVYQSFDPTNVWLEEGKQGG